MTGSRLNAMYQGTRSEFFAQYILSSLGIPVAVPNEVDVGVDFYFALAKTLRPKLSVGASCIVQVKSKSIKDKIFFGGKITDGASKGQFKKDDVEWLFSQDAPILIGIVDKAELSLELYSTCNMWKALYSAGQLPGEVWLKPDLLSEETGEVPIACGEEKSELSGIGDGKRWSVPLGNPIVAISIDDIEDEPKLQNFIAVIKRALDIDRRNINLRDANLFYSRWFLKYETNKAAGTDKIGLSLSGTRDRAVLRSQFGALATLLGVLTVNLQVHEEHKKLEAVKSLVKEMPDDLVEKIEIQKLVRVLSGS